MPDHPGDDRRRSGTVEPLEDGATPPTVLVAMGREPNARRVADWLPAGVDVVHPDDGALPDFDLCVVDEAAFGRHADPLDEAKRAASPTFLPVLLVVARDLDRLDDEVWERVDDVVRAPVRTREFEGRLRMLLRARRASTDAARERERLEEVAGIMAHDLRNPLGVARGFVEHAMETGDASVLDRAAGALTRMDDLIDDVLTLATHGSDLRVERVGLRSVVDDALRSVDTTAPTLENDIPEGTAIHADRGLLQEAFENLVRNAVEHGGESVTVSVGLLADDDGFFVADDGTGIPAAERENVFEFGYSTGEGGTGLGLAIVSRIAEAHGWSVRLVASDRGGARVEFSGCLLEGSADGAGGYRDSGDGTSGDDDGARDDDQGARGDDGVAPGGDATDARNEGERP